MMKGKYWLVWCIPVITLFGCQEKKKASLQGDAPITIKEFISAFKTMDLPYQVSDSSVIHKADDTAAISWPILSRFVPDSMLKNLIKTDKPRIYPMGRIIASNDVNYLLLKILSAERRSLLLLCFDHHDQFVAGMHALIVDANPATQQFFSIDKRYTLSKSIVRKNANGTKNEGKYVYVLNEPARSFLLIMTDALDEDKVELINPIEALPRKNKFSGDYVRDKRNIVSIRDNKKANRINFFVHFEKKDNCSGEFRGDASFTTPNTAIYRADGDLCELQLTFTGSAVTITEMQGCGSHRGVDCVFEGTFPKKKEVKKIEIKKATKKPSR